MIGLALGAISKCTHLPQPGHRAHRPVNEQEFMVVISRSHRLASVVEGGNNPDLNLATKLESLTVQATAPTVLCRDFQSG